MSGPIVRKYGFPNFDKIFGERPLEHGADEEEESVEQPDEASPAKSAERTRAKNETGERKKA